MRKNELMIVYGENWIYFKTDAETADKAYGEYVSVCENNGINIDNMQPTQIILRDENYNDIDSFC